MTAPELKPCPFCGHHPRMLITVPSIYGNEIECTNGNCPSEPHVRKDTPDEAIEAWNTRADLHDDIKAQLDTQKKRADAFAEFWRQAQAQLEKTVEALKRIRDCTQPQCGHLTALANNVLVEIEKGGV